MPSDYPKIEEISQLEKQLMADINDFNTKYSCYLYNSSNTNVNYTTPPASCSGTNYREADVIAASDRIKRVILQLSDAKANYHGIRQSEYNAIYNNLIRRYDEILNQRKDLDTKLAELYGTDDGISNYYNNKYSATMFSKIMLTILVTSLVYYTFMKIIKK
jgi:hypothetical protein